MGKTMTKNKTDNSSKVQSGGVNKPKCDDDHVVTFGELSNHSVKATLNHCHHDFDVSYKAMSDVFDQAQNGDVIRFERRDYPTDILALVIQCATVDDGKKYSIFAYYDCIKVEVRS